MKKIDFERLEYMEYWVANSFVEGVREYLINRITKFSDFDKIIYNGAKSFFEFKDDDLGEFEKLISESVWDCFEYIEEANNNGHDIKFSIEGIICFTLESLTEAMKEYIENGYKSEWEQVKVFYQKDQIGILEENETLEKFLKKEFKEISRAIEMGDCNEYPVWFDWYENIQVDLEKRPHNYIELDSEWYAYKNNFDVRK